MNRQFTTRFLAVVAIFVYLFSFSLSEAGAVNYNFCLKDDSSGITLEINSSTGDYKFKRCYDGLTLTGIGTVTVHGGDYTLQHNPSDRSVLASWGTATRKGKASLQLLALGENIKITDRDITNNNCGS